MGPLRMKTVNDNGNKMPTATYLGKAHPRQFTGNYEESAQGFRLTAVNRSLVASTFVRLSYGQIVIYMTY